MKSVIRIFCAVLVLVMVVCLAPMAISAEDDAKTVTDENGQTRTNLASMAFLQSFSKMYEFETLLTDGDRASNADGFLNKSYCSGESTSENHCAFDHRGDNTSSTKMPPEDYKNQEIGDKSYWYYIDVALEGPSTVDGFCFYLHGYKEAAMDHGFDIYYSTDEGDTWTFIVGTANPFDTTTDIHYANWDATTPYGASAADAAMETPAYIAYDLDTPLENVTNIAYACSETRCNNGYYTARFTEMEVYGTANAGTDDPGSTDTTVPGGENTTVPGGENTTVPGGENTTVPGGENTTVPGGENTTVPGGENTTVPGGDENTTVPGGDSNTTVPGGNDTTKADDKKDSSCKSTFACGIALVAVFGSAVVLGKKH